MSKVAGGASAPPIASWPPLEYETARWQVDEDSGLSRRQAELNRGDFQAAVVPHVSELEVRLPADLAADLDEATGALVRLDAHADEQLRGGAEIAPLQSILLRTESASSSQIEGLTASARKLALAEIGEETGTNAMQVHGNVRAMDAALRLAERPGVASILEMHRALMRGQDRHTPGAFRAEQVWIGGGAGPRTASFVPPLHQRVAADMQDLAAFIERNDLPSLAHAALAHAQFETIHPFTDGNGRTGRALVHAMLRRAGTTRRVATPISAGLLTDPEGYFTALTAFRQGDARPILETFARSARQAASFGTSLIDGLAEARASMRDRTTARSHSSAWPLIDLLIGQPVVNTKFVMQRLGVSAPTAGAALARLEEDGVLRQTTAGRRNRVWQSDDVLGVLDRLAERIRRASSGRA
ncbi:Fic family protein [Agrococcus lahaulensis]|uniref:Fic family protein n=1 Tax=Agrococcus lahaulensis TaxID=341722 RepID=UPI0005570385|nr:Fic family protein [Agrococcus lahaulensis]